MNILLIYPQYPDTYWSFKHAIKFIAKKSANVPLGILTVAALLPENWTKKLIDLNISPLKDKDILWADFVFISAISIQADSVSEIIKKCQELNTRIVAGGPLFTEEFEQYRQLDHLVLNESENTLPQFIRDLEAGKAKKIYQSAEYTDITKSPVPDYSLIKLGKYATAGIQYSRGCPFDCEFCDITALFGHKVRTKATTQIIAELDQLYNLGWRGSVFFVDDNFIGHKQKLKRDLLPEMISWMEERDFPFQFLTEASINLADDNELMDLMIAAGFSRVFVGIETPEENCLTECNKQQNKNRDMIQSVHLIQNKGIEVSAGFIVGFDNDPVNIFEQQAAFIKKSGIITAMVGLLNAPRLSKLYKRLNREGRITAGFSGDNTDFSINFIPRMSITDLLSGYKKLIREIYSVRSYSRRVLDFLKHYNPPKRQKLTFSRFLALPKSAILLGIINKGRRYYWSLVFWSIFHRPKMLPLAVTFSIYGYHFRKVFKEAG